MTWTKDDCRDENLIKASSGLFPTDTGSLTLRQSKAPCGVGLSDEYDDGPRDMGREDLEGELTPKQASNKHIGMDSGALTFRKAGGPQQFLGYFRSFSGPSTHSEEGETRRAAVIAKKGHVDYNSETTTRRGPPPTPTPTRRL